MFATFLNLSKKFSFHIAIYLCEPATNLLTEPNNIKHKAMIEFYQKFRFLFLFSFFFFFCKLTIDNIKAIKFCHFSLSIEKLRIQMANTMIALPFHKRQNIAFLPFLIHILHIDIVCTQWTRKFIEKCRNRLYFSI